MSSIEPQVVQTLGSSISDDVQIKILVKDSSDPSSNKYKEIYSYLIDKLTFLNKQEVVEAKLVDKATPKVQPVEKTPSVPSVSSLTTAMKQMDTPAQPA